MKAQTKVFNFKSPDYDVTFTVRVASVLDGIERGIALSEVTREPMTEEHTQTQLYSRILLARVMTVINTVCTVVNNDTKKLKVKLPLTQEQFLALPEKMIFDLDDVCQELNPHWYPEREATTEDAQGEVIEPSSENS